MSATRPVSNTKEITSGWPLPTAGRRFVTPVFLMDFLATHPMTQDLYPIAVGYYPSAAGHHMSRDQHDSYLLLYCTEGSGVVITQEHRLTIKSGDIVLLPRGTSHRYQAADSQPWSIYWIHYDGNLADMYTRLIGENLLQLDLGLQPRVIADFDALFSLQRAGFSELRFIHGSSQLKQLLTGIASSATRYQTPRAQEIDIDQIQELMHMRIESKLDLAQLAASVQLSKYHFTRRFKQLTGHSPIQHFIHLKMEFACRLLDSGADSVKQVATAVGYQDPYYFSRLFKQVIGVSPSEYRRLRHA